MRLGNTSYENFTTNHQTFPTQNERMKTPQLKLDRCCQAFELRIHNAEHPLLFFANGNQISLMSFSHGFGVPAGIL